MYHYHLGDLQPGVSYDVTVRPTAGFKLRQGDSSDVVYCQCDGPMSAPLSVTCTAPPISPQLRMEGMSADGIDLTWTAPQQFGEAAICGYQILKDGQPYGGVVPSEVHNCRVTGVTLGDKVTLQLVALTDHPVGRGEEPTSLSTDDPYLQAQYSHCAAGPKLTLHYTGLVQTPRRVWCETVTGHSAVIVWHKEHEAKAHFVLPDQYQVTWWPGNQPDNDINSSATSENFLQLQGLKSATMYTIVVEARRLQKYSELDIDQDRDHTDGSFIMSSRAQPLKLRTAQPPEPPSNVGVLASTCHSLYVAWDPPRERGTEVISIRLECTPVRSVGLDSEPYDSTIVDLMPDATRGLLNNLSERTEYQVIVRAVTEEFFHQLPPDHPVRVSKKLPVDLPQLMQQMDKNIEQWLPTDNIMCSTSGTIAPSQIEVVETALQSVKLKWRPPSVTGSNRLKGQIIRWLEVRERTDPGHGQGHPWQGHNDEIPCADYITLDPKDHEITIDGLLPGLEYRFFVEAVVSVKTVLEEDKQYLVSGMPLDDRNRRTAHVQSEPLSVRTRTPTQPPRVLVSGFSEDSISLSWEKPTLMILLPSNDASDEGRYVRHHLEGYRLEINGRPQMVLKSSAQSATLTKCRPGREYTVVLVALTVTDQVKRQMRRRPSQGSVDSETGAVSMHMEDVDEAASEPVRVMMPALDTGALRALSVELDSTTDVTAPVLDFLVKWQIDAQHTNKVSQFNLTWECDGDRTVQRKTLDSHLTETRVPILSPRAVYSIFLEPVLAAGLEPLATLERGVAVVAPGGPDKPRLCARCVSETEIVVEWAEPSLYGGVGVAGYQLHMNSKPVGDLLSSSHRKAVVPARANRTYRLSLVARSDRRGYPDSEQSNTLFLSTFTDRGRHAGVAAAPEEDAAIAEDDRDLPLRVSQRTDTSLTLDWLGYLEPAEVDNYRLQWSSVSLPQERSQTLPRQEKSCVIQNCIPGITHFVRLIAYSADQSVIDKSRQLRVQTSAPIDSPLVTLRACNFSYIAVQWTTPRCYGDALVSGYKIFVNGVVEASLSAEEHTFSYTKGKYCLEYSVQVQALCVEDRFSSKPSDPLVVIWPGCIPSELRRVPSVTSNALHVSWERPFCTETVQVKQYRVLCADADNGHMVQTVGPLHPDTLQAELHNLKFGAYAVQLEVQVHGTTTCFHSESLIIQPTLTPDPPKITVQVVGLEERRQMEKVATDLVNKKDKLVRDISAINKSPSRTFEEQQLLSRATEAYNQVEEMLEDCFTSLGHYTGHLLAQITWTCEQSSSDIQIVGFKVLVDGRQYGVSLHSGVKTVRVKLGIDKNAHRLSMVAMAERPHASSVESNAVELLTEPFLPMVFYCIHDVHNPNEIWPKRGCCHYADTLTAEKRLFSSRYNPGFLGRHVPPPSAFTRELLTGETCRLLPAGGPDRVTLLVFWTRWCLASKKYMKFLSRFAAEQGRQPSSKFSFIAVAVERTTNSMVHRELVRCVVENGWNQETKYLRHYFVFEKEKASAEDSSSMLDLFGVYGTPTMVVVHPEDYMAWRGRFCALDYGSFQEHVLGVLNAVESKQGGEERFTSFNTNGSQAAAQSTDGSLRVGQLENSLRIHQPGGGFISNDSSNSTQQKPTKLFTKSSGHNTSSSSIGKQLSVDTRPFSASKFGDTTLDSSTSHGKRPASSGTTKGNSSRSTSRTQSATSRRRHSSAKNKKTK